MSLKSLYINTLAAIALLMLSFGVEAKAQTASISLPANTAAAPGSQDVEVPITLSNNTGQIVGYVIEIQYNPTVVVPDQFPSDTSGTLSAVNNFGQGCWVMTRININYTTLNTLRLAAACNPPITAASGTLIKLRFDVVGSGGSSTPLDINPTNTDPAWPAYFEYFNAATPSRPTYVTPAATDGTFTVTGATAASVNLAGRVLIANGRGLKNAQVRLTTADGTTRTVMSSAFGYYRFTDVQAGQTVTIEIISKRYGFQPRTVNVSGDASDLNFIAEP
jgi:hypothetical protein